MITAGAVYLVIGLLLLAAAALTLIGTVADVIEGAARARSPTSASSCSSGSF